MQAQALRRGGAAITCACSNSIRATRTRRPGSSPCAAQVDPLAAESRLKTMLAAQPEASFLHFTLGNQYAAQGRWAEAQQAYFKAFASDPEHPDFAFNLAVSLDQMHQTEARAGVLPARARARREARAGFVRQAPSVSRQGRAARALTMNSPATSTEFARESAGQAPHRPDPDRPGHPHRGPAEHRAARADEVASCRSGRLLVQLGFVSEATLRDALSEKLGPAMRSTSRTSSSTRRR